MTKFTKEQLQEIIETDHVQCGEASELARIALASLEAEAVCVIDQSNLDYLKSGSDADVWPASRTEMGDVLLYLSAPPAPVSVPDEVTAEDCPAFVKYDITEVDEAWVRGFNACRAAMLQGADGNSPVIPDGYALVPVDMTPGMMRAVQINSELGAYAAANLSGAYSLFREFWDVAIAATLQQEVRP
ncbi:MULTISPECIES: hypothetical protein [Enterobacter]|uniref:hypothetical protein n=1 Tax=Enterobacter TaxID=547 RepID=UPI00066844D9|nr:MULTISPECIES: hypothetical protein [Enterobacter]CAE7591784.1 hypothetical protein AI2762V1_1169 [Enterobacter cloacae]ELE9721576.1 hypothetical protein [Enterobacter kobei]ELE9726118.1 hypothetical protein [Enterobacter kobei]MDU2819886.1 hypothetical protein [Enterobacter sp.]CAH3571239.1 hypothetical protein AI2762V1_1169 [Enterobacter cloacae]